MSVKWGLSVLDWCSHAINEHAEHPLGVFKAECGHLLMMVTTLREKPFGEPCEACAVLGFDRVMVEVPGRIHPPLSGDDQPDDDQPDDDEPDDDEPDPPVLAPPEAGARLGCGAINRRALTAAVL